MLSDILITGCISPGFGFTEFVLYERWNNKVKVKDGTVFQS